MSRRPRWRSSSKRWSLRVINGKAWACGTQLLRLNQPRSNSSMSRVGLRWSKELIPIRKRGAIWIMVGRPRKIGKRERNGRIARTYENPKAQVANQPHRRGVVVQLRECEEAGTEFG